MSLGNAVVGAAEALTEIIGEGYFQPDQLITNALEQIEQVFTYGQGVLETLPSSIQIEQSLAEIDGILTILSSLQSELQTASERE